MARDASLNQDFLDLLREMLDAGVEFVVVGAHAMAVHGVPRATGDMDLLVKPQRENATRALAALRVFGAPVDQHGLTEDDLCQPGTVYQIGLPPRRVDILTEISGVSFDEAWRGRVETEIAGLEVPVLGRAELIVNKRAAGRDKDLVDLKTLQQESVEDDL